MELSQLEMYFAKYGKNDILAFYNAYQSNLYAYADEIWREFALKFKVVTKGTKYVNLRKLEHVSRTANRYDKDLQLVGRVDVEPRRMLHFLLRNGSNRIVMEIHIDINEIEKAIKENAN